MAQDLPNKEIQALVSLLDEPDLAVYQDISANILRYGDKAMPYLEEELLTLKEEWLRQRIESLIRAIHVESLAEGIGRCLDAGNPDELLEAWLLVSRFHYPDIRTEEIKKEISSIRRNVWMEMNEHLTALEQIRVFNHVFYDIHSFHGNLEDYHDPDNSFINRLLETRRGNPLSIGVLYLLVAQSLDIPVQGINLPEHFVLAYMGDTADAQNLGMRREVPVFYINAFSKGAVFSRNEINDFLAKIGMKPMPAFFRPCSQSDIIVRMLNNLVLAYEQTGDKGRKEGIIALRDGIKRHLPSK